MPPSPFEYEKKNSPLVKVAIGLGVAGMLAVGVLLVRQLMSGSKAAPRREQEMVMIKPLTPPPPPPPPPPAPPVPKQQVEEQTQVNEQDMKPAEQTPDEPSPSLGTGLVGNGPADGFGLGGKDRGMIGGTGAGGSTGSRFGSYFNQVKQAVTEALGRHAVIRTADFDIRVRLWADTTGRINKVRLLQSTGVPEVDRLLSTEALLGCQLPDLPDGVRLPLELRLHLRRPI